MADGNMRRWEPGPTRPKHLLTVGGETLLARLVRQIHSLEPEAEIIITSHDPRYEVSGAVRYEPQNNRIELDRFTWELIGDGVCFLYGDTVYSDEAVRTICGAQTDTLLFAGSRKSIVALKVGDGERMKALVEQVRTDYEAGKLAECKGWQIFEYHTGLSRDRVEHCPCFLLISDGTRDFNKWEEYRTFQEESGTEICLNS